eukprot:TRINITY_DN20335_c0_g1_i2.p1 TRINITY_DN20335_c0_g1~~TRINITY_DN20335_c0_g1_i2.p1  ORF type:complete len:271 (+),score=84.88 TRINITY_DN20335_c0_g1_i2:398-1210(+)
MKRFGWLKVATGEKGVVLDQVVAKYKPATVLELGTYCCAYSALRMARGMPENSRIVTVEVDPIDACLARNVVEIAGRTDQVDVWIGRGSDVLPHVLRRMGPGSIDLVFMDHRGTKYHHDLEALLRLGLLRPGSVIVADNVQCPGAPEFLWQVQKSPEFITQVVQVPETPRHAEDLMTVSEYWPGRQVRLLTEEEEDDVDARPPAPIAPPSPSMLWRAARNIDSMSWRSRQRFVHQRDWSKLSAENMKLFSGFGLLSSDDGLVAGPLTDGS